MRRCSTSWQRSSAVATASWIEEQRRAEAETIERFRDLDAVIARVEAEEQRHRITADALAGQPHCNGAVALQRANDLRQVLAIVKHHQANLDRVHLLEQPNRRERKFGGGR